MTLLGTTTIEINQLRQDLVKHKLPANLKHLAKDVPPGLDLIFEDETNKRISQISATNSALQKPDNRGYSSYHKYNHKSEGNNIISLEKTSKPSQKLCT